MGKLATYALFLCIALVSITGVDAQTTISTNLTAWYTFDTGATSSTGSAAITNFVGGIGSTNCIAGNCYQGAANVSGTDNNMGNAFLGNTSTGTINFWSRQTTASDQHILSQNGGPWARVAYMGAAGFLLDWNLRQNDYYVYSPTDSQIQTGMNMWTVTWNGTNRSVYLNGTHYNSTTTGPGLLYTGLNTWYLAHNSVGTEDLVGQIDELGIWNRTLAANEIFCLYNSGTGVSYGTLNATCGQGLTYFTIYLTDQYDGSAINTFNATVNGTIYTTTNGSIQTTILQTPTTGTINITVRAANYFSKDYTHDAQANLAATVFQAQASIYAYEYITGSSVSNFNASTTTGISSDANPPVFYIKAGTHTIRFQKAGYYNFSQSITVAALSNTSYNISGVYQYLLNVTASNTSGNVNTFNATIVGSSFNATVSTTNGSAMSPWINDTVTVIVTAASNSITNTTVNLSSYTAPAYVNISLTLLAYNTFNLSFYNETSNLQLSNTTVYLEAISNSYSNNYTITGGQTSISFLVPGDYELRYYYDADVVRSYYVTLSDQSYETIRLYTIDESTSQLYLPVELDRNGYACSANTIRLMRYYIDLNGYRTVEMAKTDTNGQAVLRVQPNIINYKLSFSGTCGEYVTNPQKFTASTNTFTVSNAQSVLTSIAGISNVTRSFTYNNETQTFTFNWVDSGNLVESGCLQVVKNRLGVETTVMNNCSTGSSGSLIYTISDTNNTVYRAKYILRTSTTYSEYTDVLQASFRNVYQTFGLTGVFFTVLVTITFMFMGLGSTDKTLILGLFAIFLMGLFGFMYNTYVVLIGIAIVVAVIIYRARR